MVEANIVPYDEGRHKDQLYELYLEYAKWHKATALANYGINFENVIGGTLDEIGPKLFSVLTSLKPPKGIILILEVDGKPAGLSRLSVIEDTTAEVNNMFVSAEYRGYGYGKELLSELEKKARLFGYSTLRLGTGAHNEVAQHVYRKAGYKEIGYYESTDHDRITSDKTEDGRIYYENKIYMEKKL